MSHSSPSHCDAPARLVIFGARRTGSSLLVNLLRAQRNILMHGELFHVRFEDIDGTDGYAGVQRPHDDLLEARRSSPERLLRHVQCHAEGHTVVGLKVFRDHMRPNNWHMLTHWCSICVVLQRDDVAEQYRSLMYARSTGRWKGRTNRRAFANLTLDAAFDSWRDNTRRWYDFVEAQLARRGANASVVKLSFERDLKGAAMEPARLAPLWRALRLSAPSGIT